MGPGRPRRRCGCGFLSLRRSRNAWPWTAGLVAIAAFCLGSWGNGSFAWLQIGFLYGTEHYPYLFISSCYNLPSLMAHLNWSLKEPYWTGRLGSLHLALNWQWTLRLHGAARVDQYGNAGGARGEKSESVGGSSWALQSLMAPASCGRPAASVDRRRAHA